MRIKSLTPDLGFLRVGFVNVFFYGDPAAGDRAWVLIDTGLPGSAGLIARAARARFGEHARPGAIILTHGHFDHRGAAGRGHPDRSARGGRVGRGPPSRRRSPDRDEGRLAVP